MSATVLNFPAFFGAAAANLAFLAARASCWFPAGGIDENFMRFRTCITLVGRNAILPNILNSS
jgi:hypothetical protein